MSNTLLTIKDITREALAVLHEEIQLAKHAVRKYQDRFGNRSGQIGTSVQIRKPPRYGVYKGTDITGQLQDSTEDYATIDASATSATGGRQVVPMSFSTEDLSLKINDFSKQFIRPAVSRLARQIDLDGFNMLKVSPNVRIARQPVAGVAKSSTDPISFEDYTTLAAVLTTQLAPESDRKLFAGAIDHAGVVQSNKGLFQSSTEIAKQYEKGYMGTSASFDWIDTQNVPSIIFPANAFSGAETLGVVATGHDVAEGDTSIWVTGYTASRVLKAGSAFTVAGMGSIDPETQIQQSYLYTFIVTADTSFGATNSVAVQIPVANTIYTVATNRTVANVSALASAGAAVTAVELVNNSVLASKSAKLAFGVQKDALALAVLALEVPGGVDMGASESFEGLGLRIVRQYNALTDQWVCRIESQYGWAVLRPELIASVIGKVA